ncbi:MAG: hypothetical protein AMDU4_FER2C00034G0042 [Ferroplasma sp. Type II]|jgi:hypothetical protein|uniref:hypothetical protein n=1 Tax=Ferroplasma sp. Type II TaxID=261388 RepID=UPI0003894FB3|nr:hypothetical protein [Ferroplasma sp. Type II]EQB74033.1 MAG: hypothetical protein AMDU4_FER2C00034G0042 [Ferroplasma sp. Type II]HIH59762.1 hypothetical protein [Ferroplasma sp.]HII83013.1 hypothetical protein [Ferroplasma sp.]
MNRKVKLLGIVVIVSVMLLLNFSGIPSHSDLNGNQTISPSTSTLSSNSSLGKGSLQNGKFNYKQTSAETSSFNLSTTNNMRIANKALDTKEFELENVIGSLFGKWYNQTYGQNNRAINSTHYESLFKEFLRSSVTASLHLHDLSSLEMKSHSLPDQIPSKASFVHQVVKTGHIVKQINTTTPTPNGVYHDHSVEYVAYINGTVFKAWKVKVTTPSGSIIDPWVWVNINYFVYKAPWWLGGWSITYGEQDHYNVKFSGSAAQSFFNTWESATTDLGYGLSAAGLIALFIPVPVLAQAIGAALILVGIGLLYEGSTMLNYFESTGYSYIHMEFVNDYYYPWVVTPLGSLASSMGLYGLDNNGNSYTFWYNIPYIAYGGYTAVFFSEYISNNCHQFVNEYGSGNQIWFS